jgi:tetratricopeptide (TPR) repeat protein
MKTTLRLALALLLMLPLTSWGAPAYGECSDVLGANSSGRPHDYRDPAEKEMLDKVETNHFLPQTEQLIKGTTGPLPGDILYTLKWFTNHYRALNALANWELKKGGFKPDLVWDYDADCYFRRAIAFTPTDPTIYLIWGNFLYKKKDMQGALAKYSKAVELAPDSAEAHYDIGLLYVALGDLPNARLHADKAYQLGYPLPGLRHKLEEAEKKPGNAPRTTTQARSTS